MRRILIIFYWLFRSRNNISFRELLYFFSKPKVKTIANRFIKGITEKKDHYEVSFAPLKQKLFWPKECPIDGIYQVTAETFDEGDWHYYQKRYTEVHDDDVILDVGAAEGLFALSVIDRCKKIIMIEPNDYFYHSLTITFKDYAQKAKIYNVAVGNIEGEITFDQSSLSGHINKDHQNGTKKTITKIDSLLKNESKITYLKADLEGYEMEMLKGAAETIKKNKPKIAITTYHNENDASEIINFITELVPEYQWYVKGIFHNQGKPIMIHFSIGKPAA